MKSTGIQLAELVKRAFEGFEHRNIPAIKEARDAAMKFCLDMAGSTVEPYWITFLGPSGTGKTMLIKRITRFFSRHMDILPDHRNAPGEVWVRRGGLKVWPDAVGEMVRGDYTGIRQMRDDWFLALDDIAGEHVKSRELSASKLFEVFNAREGLFTCATANVTLDAIGERYDHRISSRLVRNGAVVVDIPSDVPDFNL